MPIPAAIWVTRMLASATALKNTKVFRKALSKGSIATDLAVASGKAVAQVGVVGLVVADPDKYVSTAVAGAGPLIEKLVELVTGLDVPNDGVRRAITGANADVVRQELGGIFTKLLDDTLQLNGVAEGFFNRNSGPEEKRNMARMVGAAFRMQIGDMLADWAGKALPFGVGDAFSQIAERIDKAINLDDAIEEIIQVPMQAVITRGLEQYYNRELRPVDMSAGEARQALIAGKLSESDYNKILDNAGYRLDIRQTLLDFAASNLTESDINEAYQSNILSREEVKEEYKNKFFMEREREIKTKLVEQTRRRKLNEKIFELYGNLYRDGVATKEEITPYLTSQGYEDDEVQMWFQVQELERRQRRWLSSGKLFDAVKQGRMLRADAIAYLTIQGMTEADANIELDMNRKFLSNSQVEDLVKDGLVDPGFAIDYQVMQGMDGMDATLLYMNFMLARFRKDLPDDCTKILSEAFSLNKLLASLLVKIPVFDVGGLFGKGDLEKILKCLVANANTPTP